MEEFIVPLIEGMRIVHETGPFDQGLATLVREDVSFWSAEELAGLRVLLGASHSVSANGSWVSNGFVYMNDAGADVLVVSGEYNPLVKDAVVATRAHREGREVYLQHDVLGVLRARAETDPDKARMSGVYRLQRKDVWGNVPVDALDAYGPTRFLLGEQAKPYGAFLQASRIVNVPFVVASVDYARNQKHDGRSFARPLWVSSLGDGSGFDGDLRVLRGGGGRVGGVRPYAREAGAPVESELERGVLEAMRGGAPSVTLGEHVYVLQEKR